MIILSKVIEIGIFFFVLILDEEVDWFFRFKEFKFGFEIMYLIFLSVRW